MNPVGDDPKKRTRRSFHLERVVEPNFAPGLDRMIVDSERVLIDGVHLRPPLLRATRVGEQPRISPALAQFLHRGSALRRGIEMIAKAGTWSWQRVAPHSLRGAIERQGPDFRRSILLAALVLELELVDDNWAKKADHAARGRF